MSGLIKKLSELQDCSSKDWARHSETPLWSTHSHSCCAKRACFWISWGHSPRWPIFGSFRALGRGWPSAFLASAWGLCSGSWGCLTFLRFVILFPALVIFHQIKQAKKCTFCLIKFSTPVYCWVWATLFIGVDCKVDKCQDDIADLID